MKIMNKNNKYKMNQAGLSLIELMIAMLVGIFLLAGITSSYVSSKNASVKRNQVSVLEDNGRLALEIISRSLEHSGYMSDGGAIVPFTTDPASIPSGGTCPDASLKVINKSIIKMTANDASAVGDTISISFQGDNNLSTDCTGNVLPAGCETKIYNSFFVDAATNKLNCSGSRSAKAEVIADGVENIQFLYGKGDTGQVVQYVNSAAIAAGSWGNIVSVQVAILIRSEKKVKTEAESKTYTLLDTVVTSPSDRYQREVFSTTIQLRNTL